MSDYSATRSEYLKVMMGNKKDALAPYRPDQLNDLGDTSLDVASLSDDDINAAVEQIKGTQYESTEAFKSLSGEQAKRSEQKAEEESSKSWLEHVGDFFSNIGTSVTEGILSVVDDLWDFTIGVAGGLGGGWWGHENGFTDWVADAMTDDRWISYATKALTLTDWTNKDAYTAEYWTDWSYEGITKEKDRAYEGQEWLHTGGNFVGKVIPSLVLAYFTGGSSLGAQAAAQGGLALSSAYGSSASKALEEGASFQGASAYGATKGVISGAISAATVGIGASALGQSGGIAGKVGDAVSNKVALMTTSQTAEVFASKASEALVQAGFSAAQGFSEAMADPLVQQITYNSDAIAEAYGDDEKVKQTLYNASMAALTSAASSLATSAIREGGARLIEGKDRYYANFYTQKASRAQSALEKEIKSLNDSIQSGKEVDMDASLARIERLSKEVETLGQKSLERWQAFSEKSTVEAQTGTDAFDENGNPIDATKETVKTPIDEARYKRQVKQFGSLIKRKNLTDLVLKNIEGKASSASVPQLTFNGNGGVTAYLGNAIVEYQEGSDVAVYSDATNPDLPSFEVKESANGVPTISAKTPEEIETVASLMADGDAKTTLPEVMSLPLGNGDVDVLLSELSTPEQVRNLALLENKDLRKVGDVEIADLKDGKVVVFSNGRKTAQIENYDGSFKEYLNEIGTRQKTFGDFVNGTYNVPDGKDDFGAIQAASRAMPNWVVQRYRAGKGIDEKLRNRLSRAFRLELDATRGGRIYRKRSLLNPKTNTKAVICEDVDNKVFHDVFEIARKFLKNGELVDLHESETADGNIGYNDCECFLSEDGLSGFAITKESKDLISVFSLWKEGGFLKTAAPIIQEKAKTLDGYISYKQPLDKIYEKILGFKVAAVMDWNGEYDHDDIGANHGNPKVAFMVNPKFATKEIETKTFGKDEYDQAKAWQMSFLKTPKEEVEDKYGKDVSKAPASLIIEAANAKEGKAYNLTNTAKTINKIEEVLQAIVEGDVPEVALGGEFKIALKEKGDLSKDVFTQLNLMKAEDKTAVKKYIEKKLLETDVEYNGEDGTTERYSLNEILGDSEKKELGTALDKAFDELERNGKTSRYSKLLNAYESKVEALIRENMDVRARAKIVAETQKRWNSLASKLGLNGKASSLKTILSGGSDADIQFVDMMRSLVKETRVSSRTGLSTSPKAMNRIVEFAKGFTYERFGDGYFWDEGIALALGPILADAEGHGGEFNVNRELTAEEQGHINNLLKAINHKLSDETVKIYEKRVADAKEGVTLYGATKPKKYGKYLGALQGAWDSAEGLAQYLANTIGKENPNYSLIVDGWVKAKGKKLSYAGKYAQLTNDILKENGYKPSKGFKFLSRKVSFKGEKITLGEAASILFSAKTKEDIASGENLLNVYSEKTKSYSREFRLNGEEDLRTLEGFFTEHELKVLNSLKDDVLNGEMKDDFIQWFKDAYGYTPELSEDYFTLSASSAKAELSAQQKAMGQGMLLGQSWGKARARVNYKGAYRITPFEQVYGTYLQDLSHYIGFTDYNNRIRTALNTKVEHKGRKVSFNELMTKNAPNWSSNKEVGGKSWLNYFQLIATDSKAGDGSGIGAIVSKLTRGAQTAVLGLNPSSIAKQFGSGFTVMGDVGIATYLKAQKRVPYNLSHYASVRKFLTNSDNYVDTTDPENAELEPLFALVKDRFDNGGALKGKMSSNIQDDIIGKVGKVTLAGMGFADEANNVINVWSVAEQLAHDNEGLAFGTVENKTQALKYFVKLLFTTQSNNNEMYVSKGRSGYMGHGMKELFFLFASDSQNKLQQFDSITREFAGAKERAKAYDGIINDLNSSQEEKEAAQRAKERIERDYSGKKWVKQASGVVAGLVMSGLFVALVDEVRERLLAKNGKRIGDWSDFDWMDFFKVSALESFVNWVPYVSTVANAVENNSDVSLFTADAINDMISAFRDGDTADKVKNITIQIGTAFGLPLSNIYKYVKGIVRNSSESAYLQSFGWLEGISSASIAESYKAAIKKNDVSGAVEILSINYSLHKTGTADRKTLLEVAKLSQKGYSAVARNAPDYITDEEGNKQMLTDAQKSSFSSYYKRANASVAKLITTSSYLKQDDESKAKLIKKVYDLYYEFAKAKSLNSATSSKLGALLAAAGGNYDVATAVLLIQENSQFAATRLRTRKEQAVSLVNKQSMTRSQKLLTLYLMGYGISDESKTSVRNYLISLGMSRSEAEALLA